MVTPAIRENRLGLKLLCNSAASRFITMRRLKTNSHPSISRAATAALLLGLSMPAFATTTHKPHHAKAQPAAAAAAPATMPVSTKASAAKAPTVAAKKTHAHPQAAVAVKPAADKPAHTHTVAVKAAKTKKPAAHQQTARVAPVPKPMSKPSQADFEAAARVHAWEASHNSPDAAPTTPPAPQKATAEDFIRASQPVPGNSDVAPIVQAAPAPAAAAAPAPKPVRDSVRAPKSSKAAPQPLSPAVAKMLPGADDETTPGLASAEASVSPMIAPAMVPLMYNKRGRIIMPAALKGSHDILVHQNTMADSEGLDRIQDDDDLARKIINKQLVPIPASSMLRVDDRLPLNRRYCRPWVAQFLTDMARAHYARFHTPLQVNSAVRTVEFQEKLRRTNGNAAPTDGDTASPHLTGFAVDIAKKPLSQTEIAWMRGYLLPLEQQGKIDVEEEFQQACFHMSVYRKYVPGTPGAPRSQPAGSATDIMATSLR
jgi:hypothetical protein